MKIFLSKSEIVKIYRARKKMTVKELAKAVGLGDKAITNLENGKFFVQEHYMEIMKFFKETEKKNGATHARLPRRGRVPGGRRL